MDANAAYLPLLLDSFVVHEGGFRHELRGDYGIGLVWIFNAERASEIYPNALQIV